MLTNRIWCRACEAPRYAERVPSFEELNLAAALRRLPDHPRPEFVEEELLDLDDEQFKFIFAHLAKRPPSSNCLSRGGDSLVELQIAIDRVVNLRHECGGAFRFNQVFFLGFGPRVLRWFDVSGQFLGTQEDRF